MLSTPDNICSVAGEPPQICSQRLKYKNTTLPCPFILPESTACLNLMHTASNFVVNTCLVISVFCVDNLCLNLLLPLVFLDTVPTLIAKYLCTYYEWIPSLYPQQPSKLCNRVLLLTTTLLHRIHLFKHVHGPYARIHCWHLACSS